MKSFHQNGNLLPLKNGGKKRTMTLNGTDLLISLNSQTIMEMSNFSRMDLPPVMSFKDI